mmetsp:Transcript_100997/g.286240  ORF Transcript_100997/g.286240 Transcript_100997/m.286240 type:complete len:585 (-) Transcript_100997:169-1923(-)
MVMCSWASANQLEATSCLRSTSHVSRCFAKVVFSVSAFASSIAFFTGSAMSLAGSFVLSSALWTRIPSLMRARVDITTARFALLSSSRMSANALFSTRSAAGKFSHSVWYSAMWCCASDWNPRSFSSSKRNFASVASDTAGLYSSSMKWSAAITRRAFPSMCRSPALWKTSCASLAAFIASSHFSFFTCTMTARCWAQPSSMGSSMSLKSCTASRTTCSTSTYSLASSWTWAMVWRAAAWCRRLFMSRAIDSPSSARSSAWARSLFLRSVSASRPRVSTSATWSWACRNPVSSFFTSFAAVSPSLFATYARTSVLSARRCSGFPWASSANIATASFPAARDSRMFSSSSCHWAIARCSSASCFFMPSSLYRASAAFEACVAISCCSLENRATPSECRALASPFLSCCSLAISSALFACPTASGYDLIWMCTSVSASSAMASIFLSPISRYVLTASFACRIACCLYLLPVLKLFTLASAISIAAWPLLSPTFLKSSSSFAAMSSAASGFSCFWLACRLIASMTTRSASTVPSLSPTSRKIPRASFPARSASSTSSSSSRWPSATESSTAASRFLVPCWPSSASAV